MTSVFCLFKKITVDKDHHIDVLAEIYSLQHEKEANEEANKRNSEQKHYYHVEMWNVQ